MRLIATLSIALIGLAGCATPVAPNITHASDAAEQRMIPLTELAANLDLTVEDGSFTGEKILTDDRGNRASVYAETPQKYLYNLYPRAVEFPFIQVKDRELYIPVGAYNSLCKDFGRTDALIQRQGVSTDRPFRDNVKLRAPSAEEIEAAARPKAPVAPNGKPAAVSNGSLSGWTIAIDAGHGGKDPGGISNGVEEKDVALSTARKVKSLLEGKGATVVMTRANDTFVELEERAAIANRAKATLFISLHANIAPNSDTASGIETWFAEDGERGNRSRSLAGKINANAVSQSGARNRGVKQDTFRVLRLTEMPAVLVELGFLSNPLEAKRLSEDSYQDKLAAGVLAGVLEYAASPAKPQPVVSK